MNNKTLELVDGEESFHDEVPNQITWSIVKTDSKLKLVHIGTSKTVSNSTTISISPAGDSNAHPSGSGVNSDSQNEVRARLPKLEMKKV